MIDSMTLKGAAMVASNRIGMWISAVCVCCWSLCPGGPETRAQSPAEDTGESVERREGPYVVIAPVGSARYSTYRRVLELTPAKEAQPALSIQLIPEDIDRKDGNAAIFYLQAMGFLENTNALEMKLAFERSSMEAARQADDDFGNYPPYGWLDFRPEQLPIDEVKKYLTFTHFQQRYLKEAALRRDCDFDRRIKEVDNPVGLVVSEIQAMRELARQQSLRCLLAIAEGDVDRAVEILGQQLAMASHLEKDFILVSSLVGIACAGIALKDAFYLSEHPNAPNLYWAVASLPKPLVSLRPALSLERQFLFLQFKALQQVGEDPLPNDYWKRFVQDFMVAMREVDDSFGRLDEAAWAGAIGMGVPGARKYLRDIVGLDEATLERLPNTQIFFLAVRRYSERARDEMVKPLFVSVGQSEMFAAAEQRFRDDANEYGFITLPASFFLPAVNTALTAQRRVEQQIAIFQIVESIRHHLAIHGGELPKALGELELPAPTDPGSGQPFEYELRPEGAMLRGVAFPGLRYELILKVKQ
jgi:hypothetical protein